jgi:LPS-assembly protein
LFSSQQELLFRGQAQLSENWFLTGAIRYDIDESLRLQDSIGLKYADECFVLEVTYAETFIKDIKQDIRPDQKVMVRFELKHLGGFGTGSDQLTSQFAANQPPKY